MPNFRITFFGPQGSGKDALWNRLRHKPWAEKSRPTISPDFFHTDLDNDLRLEFWNTPGDSRYEGIANALIGQSHVIVVTLEAVRNHPKREEQQRWLQHWLDKASGLLQAKGFTKDNPIDFYLVTTKCDLITSGGRPFNVLENWSGAAGAGIVFPNNIRYQQTVHCSSKSGAGVSNLFDQLQAACRRLHSAASKQPSPQMLSSPELKTLYNDQYRCLFTIPSSYQKFLGQRYERHSTLATRIADLFGDYANYLSLRHLPRIHWRHHRPEARAIETYLRANPDLTAAEIMNYLELHASVPKNPRGSFARRLQFTLAHCQAIVERDENTKRSAKFSCKQ